jgi:hypothetical protein
MSTGEVGAICFGAVMGWIVYRTLRRNSAPVTVRDISTVFAAVGGAAVTTIFKGDTLFGCYAIGLACGFFGYLVVGHIANSRWLG